MIFYFSGTGNSQAIAMQIAQALNDTACDIMGAAPEAYQFTKNDTLGFVFPIYAWAAPEIMLDFAAKINPGAAFTFAVATFSNVAGLALEQFSQILPLKSGYGVKMPDNFPVLDHILETHDSAMVKLADAKTRLAEIIPRIAAKKEEFDILIGEDGQNRTFALSLKFNAGQRATKPYWVSTELCTNCGLCEKLCPVNAIEMQDGIPVWRKEQCYLCMACLNRCPTQAIEYGQYSSGQFRYYFKGFDASNYSQG